MKLSTKVYLLSALALVAADETVQLVASSKDGTIKNQGLYAKHEGAGINWVFLGQTPQDYSYDGKTLSLPGGAGNTIPAVPLVFDGPSDYKAFQFSVAGTPVTATFSSDGSLILNGTDPKLKACKNINDSYRYSTAEYAVVQGNPVGGQCVDIVVKRKINTVSPPPNNSTQNTTSSISSTGVVSGASANSASAGIAVLAVGAAAMLL